MDEAEFQRYESLGFAPKPSSVSMQAILLGTFLVGVMGMLFVVWYFNSDDNQEEKDGRGRGGKQLVTESSSKKEATQAHAHVRAQQQQLKIQKRLGIQQVQTACAKQGSKDDSCNHSLKGHQGFVTSACLSSDGSFAVSTSSDRTVRIWAIAGPDKKNVPFSRYNLQGSFYGVACAIANDNTKAAVATNEGNLLLFTLEYDRAFQAPQLVLKRQFSTGHKADIRSVYIHPTSSHVITCCQGGDTAIKVWDFAGASLVQTLNPLQLSNYGCALSQDGSFLAAGTQMAGVKVWAVGGKGRSIADKPQQALFLNHSKAALSVAFSSDGGATVIGGADGSLALFNSNVRWKDNESAKLLGTCKTPLPSVDLLALSPDGSTIACVHHHSLLLYSAAALSAAFSDASPPALVTYCVPSTLSALKSLSFASDGRTVMVAGSDSAVRFYMVPNVDVDDQEDAEKGI